jgi:sublancin family glycopeptide
MKDLIKELNLEELETFEGGYDGVNYSNANDDKTGGGSGGIGTAQCAYFKALCYYSGGAETWGSWGGCGSTQNNCELARKYC